MAAQFSTATTNTRRMEMKTLTGNLTEALFDVLDALGALSNPNELIGWGISQERADEIVKLCKDSKEAMEKEGN
jgi:hypothetical protein